MVPLPDTLLSKMSIDTETVRRMYEDDPFFRARAFRYSQLEQAIHDGEAGADAETIAKKYLVMLKKRREDMLLELIDLVVKNTAETQKPLWRLPPVQRGAIAAAISANRPWRWP